MGEWLNLSYRSRCVFLILFIKRISDILFELDVAKFRRLGVRESTDEMIDDGGEWWLSKFMKVIRQLLITWMLVAFLVFQGFGQDVKIQPPPPPKPLPLPKKIIPKSVSDKNSSKPKAEVRKIPTRSGRIITIPGRKPIAQRKSLDWSDFTYNSPEEEAFWDKLPEGSFSSKILNGYVKSKSYFGRTIYQFVNGYAVRSKTWRKDGQKKLEQNYKKGLRDGLSTSWYENGQKKKEGNFKDDGKLDGLQTEWHENGQKKEELNYKDGKLSLAKVWLPVGKECPESKVIDGNGTLITYSLEGKEISRRNIKAGTILIPPRQILPIPKRSASSDANSSKSAPSLPPWLVPAFPK